jgi:hypothetical protein
MKESSFLISFVLKWLVLSFTWNLQKLTILSKMSFAFYLDSIASYITTIDERYIGNYLQGSVRPNQDTRTIGWLQYVRFLAVDIYDRHTKLCLLLFYASFLLPILFDPEEGGDMFLRNVGWLATDYLALYPRRHNSLCSSLICSYSYASDNFIKLHFTIIIRSVKLTHNE